MPEAAYDLREIARSALNDMLEDKRAAFLAEMLTELRGPQAIEHLSTVRAAVSLRMQELIDEKFPLDGVAAARARFAGLPPKPDAHEAARMSAQEKSDLENRIYFSPSPWREALRWLNESWEDGWNLPDNGEAFIGEVLIRASDLSGMRGRSKK
ncbi:hypothetical protein F8A10_12005 [Paracoccus kondratievae]|uniref:hypothetical protein n=1 Tax=Paracoccus kondratievae TaxID=135740 RepID=UPI00126670BC|nr:hypothetical protein [Paracoccus kondratievae]QFQ88235.1 hypothetical protein F8A10_12005 [Paracoccus kondratievae]